MNKQEQTTVQKSEIIEESVTEPHNESVKEEEEEEIVESSSVLFPEVTTTNNLIKPKLNRSALKTTTTTTPITSIINSNPNPSEKTQIKIDEVTSSGVEDSPKEFTVVTNNTLQDTETESKECPEEKQTTIEESDCNNEMTTSETTVEEDSDERNERLNPKQTVERDSSTAAISGFSSDYNQRNNNNNNSGGSRGGGFGQKNIRGINPMQRGGGGVGIGPGGRHFGKRGGPMAGGQMYPSQLQQQRHPFQSQDMYNKLHQFHPAAGGGGGGPSGGPMMGGGGIPNNNMFNNMDQGPYRGGPLPPQLSQQSNIRHQHPHQHPNELLRPPMGQQQHQQQQHRQNEFNRGGGFMTNDGNRMYRPFGPNMIRVGGLGVGPGSGGGGHPRFDGNMRLRLPLNVQGSQFQQQQQQRPNFVGQLQPPPLQQQQPSSHPGNIMIVRTPVQPHLHSNMSMSQTSAPLLPRKILINPNFKRGVEAAKTQLMMENLQYMSHMGHAAPVVVPMQTDEDLLRQQEAFINQNRMHIEKRRHERTPERERDYSPSPRRERRGHSRERSDYVGRNSSNYRGGRMRRDGLDGKSLSKRPRSGSFDRGNSDKVKTEEEDEETRNYRLEIEKQKAQREKILREKEERRKRAAEDKYKDPATVSIFSIAYNNNGR